MVEHSPKILASEKKATTTYHKKQHRTLKFQNPEEGEKKTVVNTPNIKTSLTAS